MLDDHCQKEDENLPLFLADFVDIDGKSPHPIAPRSILKRVLKQAEELGIGFKSAFEYEFFIFNETADTIREKGYRNLKPLTPGMFGYSILRASSLSDLFNEFMEYSDSLNIPLEAVHCETGPGVWEAAIEVDYALAAADKATLFKTFAKVFFQRREMVATFMARWSLDYPGQSGHVHLSPYSLDDGKNLFYDPSRKNNMSSMMEHFLAGMITHMRPFLSMTAPTINSYTRLVKGFWAPTAATWGVENRTTALRVVPGSDKSQRVEYRVGAADSNPYLTAAALIGAGLEGINSKLKLSAPVIGSAYDVQDSLDSSLQLPSSLKESTLGLRQSEEAVSLFGAKFVDHFAKSREWEVAEYEKVITDWQLSRYFEII